MLCSVMQKPKLRRLSNIEIFPESLSALFGNAETETTGLFLFKNLYKENLFLK